MLLTLAYCDTRTSTLFVSGLSVNYDFTGLTLHSSTSYIKDNTYGVNVPAITRRPEDIPQSR
jgi:hypothetical protein